MKAYENGDFEGIKLEISEQEFAKLKESQR
jgi:hypothetical protein